MFKILVCEDEFTIRKLIVTFLKKKGFDLLEAENGKMAYEIIENNHVDLIITDIMMPVMDGYTLVYKARQLFQDIPILMLTALERYQDKEKGYLSGIDDYLVKPVDLNELYLRIQALLKRYQITRKNKIELKHTVLDYQKHEAYVDGNPIELTNKEFLLLFKLLSNPQIIFTREQLMNEIWGFDTESYDRTVDTHIKRIREKIIVDDFEIIAVRGIGYKGIIK
ncbi:MAG: response regulator transcription factor [Bacilli bacterium]